MTGDVTKAVEAIKHWIGHETAHLSPAEQYEAFRKVSRSCERMSDELLKEAAHEIRPAHAPTAGTHPWERCSILACKPNQRCMNSDNCSAVTGDSSQ